MALSGPPKGGWYSRPTAILFGLVIAGTLFAILFPWFPGGTKLREGDTSPWTLTAPRDLSFDSDVLTAAARDEAAAAVEVVTRRDDSIPTRQLAELDRQLSEVEAAREATLADSARESRIRAATADALSERSIEALARASDAEFREMSDEARAALGLVLARSISDGGVEDARRDAAALLSALLDSGQLLALTELLDPLIVPTLVANEALTEQKRQEARESVPPVPVTRERGQVLVDEGESVTAATTELLERAELDTSSVRGTDIVATLLLALIAGGGTGAYLYVARPRALAGIRRLTLFLLLVLVPAAALKFTLPLLLPDIERHFIAYAIPLAAAPMAAVVLLDLGVAVLLVILLLAIGSYVSIYLPFADAAGAGQLETARVSLTIGSASLAGMFVAARATHLNRYLVAGLAVAIASVAALLTIWLIDADRQLADLAWIVSAAAASGLASALIGVGFFVLLSRPFGIITRVELMELAQLSHPLLRRLQDEAPGTFQHSVMVSNMGERAADRIGADPLLVRVGGYYHDVGKLAAPGFFVENAGNGEDPHASLDPLQSTRVIQQHVTAGTEIARREGLPAAVLQFIPQHHGTRRVQFFYRRAAAEDPDIDPDLFRYPGPKPQTREAAIVMLADSSEATVRASSDRSGERIREIVDATVRERIEEGQFEECDISLRDLRIVADSFVQTLNAVYHPRVEYPEPTARELEERNVTALPERPLGEPNSAGGSPSSASPAARAAGGEGREGEDER